MDDIDDFLTQIEKYEEKKSNSRLSGLASAPYGDEPDNKGIPAGEVCQYSKYGPGYSPATATTPSLPPGCYTIMADNNGIHAMPAPPPTGLLLELPEMRSEEVINVAERFWDSEKDYKEGNEFVHGGAAFKAGVMLYGPPGSGKSCTVKIVSKKIVERGGTVFFADTNPTIVSAFLTSFATIEKSRKSVVILEDIDSLINAYGEANYLSMLDSAQSIDNVLFIATTNYPDRLDPRIYNRPGRFSHVIKIGLPGPKAREAFLKAILKDYRDVAAIVEKTEGFSIDHLASLVNSVYREKKPLAGEMDRLRRLFKIPKADESNPIGF